MGFPKLFSENLKDSLHIHNFCYRGYLCNNWKPSFSPLLIFNWRTFLKSASKKSSVDQSELEK